MNTPFKSNSRFACLIDDIPENKKNKKYEGKILKGMNKELELM